MPTLPPERSMRGRSAGVRPRFQEIRRIMHRGWIAQPNSCQDCTVLALSFFLPCLACNCQLMPRRLLFLFYSLQIKSELLQLRICDQHARTLCGQPAKILVSSHLKSLQFIRQNSWFDPLTFASGSHPSTMKLANLGSISSLALCVMPTWHA